MRVAWESLLAQSEPRGGLPPNRAGFRDHFSVLHPNQCLSSVGACSGVLSYVGEMDS